jgi:hypothetical protein
MKRTYIYSAIAIFVILFVLSRNNVEGFNTTPFWQTDWFIMTMLISLVIVTPLLYLIYKYFIHGVIQQSLVAGTTGNS